MKIFKSFYIQPGSGCLHALLAIGVRMPWVCCWFNLYADNNNKRLAVKYNARGKWDLLPSFVHAKSYGYIMGSLREAQLPCIVFRFRKETVVIVGYVLQPPCVFTGRVRSSKIARCTCVSRKNFIKIRPQTTSLRMRLNIYPVFPYNCSKWGSVNKKTPSETRGLLRFEI